MEDHPLPVEADLPSLIVSQQSTREVKRGIWPQGTAVQVN
jgi:hypothetical protein